jgi:hypothetical protein
LLVANNAKQTRRRAYTKHTRIYTHPCQTRTAPGKACPAAPRACCRACGAPPNRGRRRRSGRWLARGRCARRGSHGRGATVFFAFTGFGGLSIVGCGEWRWWWSR